MAFDNSDFLLIVVIALCIYVVSNEWQKLDDKHLELRDKRKCSEPDLLKEEDQLIYQKALTNKNRAIVDYRNKYHISLSCAQEIVESILTAGTKAQSK
ncbi:hypothetical protein EIK76_16725 [Rheinheimera mesophila]|uniref:Uncharacterized protein n=1 Tax=Rheinheimera mesophila TaxID=1547515 RepID=A0A3P3QCN2_9GAMM|nr:hypothetical protein [Rheinheimera mesophila]KKL01765.1 hypothetical protein SD53_08625 [Rheinheimera mesophila]RRJ18864.1 hypothetical protein EIK76_16725 [Rheinheimera mesophila]